MPPRRPTADLPGQALPVELMNTIRADRRGVHDRLATLEDARRWVELIGSRAELSGLDGAVELGRDALPGLRNLRDAVRRIAAEHTHDPRERAVSPTPDLATAVAVVNDSVRGAQLWPALQLTEGGIVERRDASGPPDALLIGVLAAEAIRLFGQGDDLELRACLAPNCALYFIKDHPRREWCSPACGNRARAVRHYARHGKGPGAR